MFKTLKSIWQGLTQKGKNLPASACIHATDSFAQLGAFRRNKSYNGCTLRHTTAFWKWAAELVISARHWRNRFRKDDWWRRIYSRKMLAYTEKRLRRRHIDNVDYYLCDGTHFDFPDQSFDRIVLITVLGEVANQAEYLAEFRRLLRPDGLLSVSETAGDPDKPSRTELRDLMRQNGFETADEYGSERNFTLNFKASSRLPPA